MAVFNFFVPKSKVQKDRQIMRETDLRVAKYTRRGLILNLLVFSLCLLFGNFQVHEHNTAIVLLAGLLISTLWRGYYLFRFDALYSKGPSRWRNQYFFASCLGALWWSVILVTLTWKLGMKNETLIMWLYSVVFYSSVSSVFAPYKQFLTLYLFIGQIPAALTAIFLGSVEGVLYGFIMITFYLMLVYQGGITASAYWERFEANLALRERASGLESENRSSQAQLDLKDEFLSSLGHELRSSIGDVLSTLSSINDSQLSERQKELLSVAISDTARQIDLVNNVVDFSKISKKSLLLEPLEFDLVRVLEKFIQDSSLSAHQAGIELYYSFDAQMPLRVRADLLRMNQVLSGVMSHALKSSRIDHIYVEAHFTQSNSNDGILSLIISDREKVETDNANLDKPEDLPGIGLSIAKGLAECMGGNLQFSSNRQRGKRIIITLKLEVVSQEEHHLGEEHRLEGKDILLVDLPESSANFLAGEIAFWGMKTHVAHGHDQALQRLKEARDGGAPIDIILIYTRLGSAASMILSRDLVSLPEYADLKQILAMSPIQSETLELQEYLAEHHHISVIEKPVMRKRLYDVLVRKLLNEQPGIDEHDLGRPLGNLVGRKILLISQHRVDQMILTSMLKKMGCYTQVTQTAADAYEVLQQENFDLLVIDYDEKDREQLSIVEKVREQEQGSLDSERLPIIAMTATELDVVAPAVSESDIDDVVAKTIRFDELRSRIINWLR